MSKRGKKVFHSFSDFNDPTGHGLFIKNYERKKQRSPEEWDKLVRTHGFKKIAFMEDLNPKTLRRALYGTYREALDFVKRNNNLIKMNKANEKVHNTVNNNS